MDKNRMTFTQVEEEVNQRHKTRIPLFETIEEKIGKTVISFFTSTNFPAMIEHGDADMLEQVFSTCDLSNGLALIINSYGGDALAAERIISLCREYSGTKGFTAIVPGRAKSAATMICLGADNIWMGPGSELGPVDPQVWIKAGDGSRACSVFNIIQSYKDLFKKAVECKGKLEPYLQQLAKYDEREIREYENAMELAQDIVIKALQSGMMLNEDKDVIQSKIEPLLTPKHTKSHGRAISRNDSVCANLKITNAENVYGEVEKDKDLWDNIFALYIRTQAFVSTRATKCIESKQHSLVVGRG